MRKVVRCKCCGKVVVVCYSKDEVFNSREYSIKCSSCKSYAIKLKNSLNDNSKRIYEYNIPTDDLNSKASYNKQYDKHLAAPLPSMLLLNPLSISMAMSAIPLFMLLAYIKRLDNK